MPRSSTVCSAISASCYRREQRKLVILLHACLQPVCMNDIAPVDKDVDKWFECSLRCEDLLFQRRKHPDQRLEDIDDPIAVVCRDFYRFA